MSGFSKRAVCILCQVAFSMLPGAVSLSAEDPGTRHPSDIPAADFFRPEAFSSPKLNPAGTRVAMLIPDRKVDGVGLFVQEFATGKLGGFPASKAYDLSSYRWSGNDRIFFSVRSDDLYAQGLHSLPWDKPAKRAKHFPIYVLKILGSPRTQPNHLIIWVRESDAKDGASGDLQVINTSYDFGGRKMLFVRNEDIIKQTIDPPAKTTAKHWFVDRDNEVRYVIASSTDDAHCYRREKNGTWTLLPLDIERDTPLGVDASPNVIFLAHHNEQGVCELVRYDTAQGRYGPVLHTDEKYDFRGATLHYSVSTMELIGLSYDRPSPTQVWFRQQETAWQQSLDATLPANHVNMIVSRSEDGRRMLVRSSSDRHPGSLYLFESDTNQLKKLAESASWLPEHLLGEVRLMTYKTRDGLKLDAYITLPANHDTGKPAPTIVLPHGNPSGRNVWGYDPESQFFASRGYVVFRPSHRGASGYSANSNLKPRMDFRQMHDDVTDGVRALIKAGIADPARIAICGGSFGGYLAVCGAAFEPGLYKCAITIAGIFDWARVMKEARANDPDSSRYDYLLRELGDPKKHQEKFDAMSPILSAAQIKIPVFIVHGVEDQVADSGQSHRLAKALAKAGVPCETMFASGEAHGFASLKNRVELFTRIESFLKKHL